MVFENGDKVEDFNVIGIVGKCNIGIIVCFWFDVSYFDLVNFFIIKFNYLLKVKVVLCLGLCIKFINK